MRTPKTILIFLLLILNSCTSDNAEPTKHDSGYAMTATVDGIEWEMNNPFNSNTATKSLFNYYPTTEFIQLQGRKGLNEIVLLIKRSDLKKGEIPIGLATYDASKTQIEMYYTIKETSQYVVEGLLVINDIDVNAKIVAGTFAFNCAAENKPISASNPVTTKVTHGIFNYKYDVAN